MQQHIQKVLWRQFASSIDMLGNAIAALPAEKWADDKRLLYMAYHSLLFLDYYLTIPPTNFSAGLPFTLVPYDEIPAGALDDLLPERPYSQAECLAYLQASRDKCQRLLEGLSLADLEKGWIAQPDIIAPGCTMHFSVLDILLYNLRHVQHHTGQFNLLLRQMGVAPPDWVPEMKD